MLARVCVGLAALLVLGWLGVMERDGRLAASGAAVVRPGATDAVLARAETDLRRARLLNPDTRPDVDRALMQRARGDARAASATITDVVSREPDNAVAWGVLAVLSRGSDPAASRRAAAALRRLDPVNARRPSARPGR